MNWGIQFPLGLQSCRSICVHCKDALDKTAKVLHGSVERLHNRESGITHTLLCSFAPFLTHSFPSNTFNTLSHCCFSAFSSQYHRFLSLFAPFSLGFFFSFLHSQTHMDCFPLSCPPCTLLLARNFSCCTFLVSLFLPLLSFHPIPFFLYTDWISCPSPSLRIISSHFPDCSILSLQHFALPHPLTFFFIKQTATLFSMGMRESERARGPVG